MKGRGLVVALAVLGASSCAERPGAGASPEAESAALGGEVAARVDGAPIAVAAVARVAEAQRVPAREALRRLVDDEVAAAAARARGLDRTTVASWRLVSARARFASERVYEEARQQGPPTDEEVALLSQRHWVEVDRPPTLRVVHAVVMAPKDPAQAPAARALAAELRDATATASDADFERAAESVPHEKSLTVRVERLPPFTEEGWVVEGGGRLAPTFVRAAFALAEVGDTSAVVESPFGFHVIRLVQRIAERRMPIDQRRIAFAQEVRALRAHEALSARLDALRAAHEVVVSPAADSIMRTVSASAGAVGAP